MLPQNVDCRTPCRGSQSKAAIWRICSFNLTYSLTLEEQAPQHSLQLNFSLLNTVALIISQHAQGSNSGGSVRVMTSVFINLPCFVSALGLPFPARNDTNPSFRHSSRSITIMLIQGIADKKKMQKVIAVLYIPVISMSRTCVYLFLFCCYCYCRSGCKILLEIDLINGYGCRMKCCWILELLSMLWETGINNTDYILDCVKLLMYLVSM